MQLRQQMKSDRVYHDWVQSLRQAGWDVDKADSIKFNGGSETATHAHCKLAGARILRDAGYRIDTEVVHPERGEIDLIAIPTKDSQEPFGVEFETDPDTQTVRSKLARYHDGTPFVEIFVIGIEQMPTELREMRIEIKQQL